jgi:hypothetical protein
MFAALENLEAEAILMLGKRLEKIQQFQPKSLGYYELKTYKTWYHEVCSKLLDQRKQAKLQLLQDLSELTGDKLNNTRGEASRHFRRKTREYLKDKTNELATNSKIKDIRDLYREIKEFKRGLRTKK